MTPRSWPGRNEKFSIYGTDETEPLPDLWMHHGIPVSFSLSAGAALRLKTLAGLFSVAAFLVVGCSSTIVLKERVWQQRAGSLFL